MSDGFVLARALHVLGVVHWIGGVAMVTLVILPALRDQGGDLAAFERLEGRFARQARLSTLLVGATGFWMTHLLGAWDRFRDPALWWMHAMVALWAIFTLMLFVAEPLFLHRWFRDRARRDPPGTLRLVHRLHVVLLLLSTVTVLGAVLGAHGGI